MRLSPNFLLLALPFLAASCGESKTDATADADTMATQEPAEIDCVFRVDTISDAFLKNNPEFADYVWDNEKKEAKIRLKNGDSLYVQISGCNSLSANATLTRMNDKTSFSDSEHWFDEAMWIATHVVGFEPQLLEEIHDKKQYEAYAEEDGVFFEMTGDQDFVISVQREKGGKVATTLIHSYN